MKTEAQINELNEKIDQKWVELLKLLVEGYCDYYEILVEGSDYGYNVRDLNDYFNIDTFISEMSEGNKWVDVVSVYYKEAKLEEMLRKAKLERKKLIGK